MTLELTLECGKAMLIQLVTCIMRIIRELNEIFHLLEKQKANYNFLPESLKHTLPN